MFVSSQTTEKSINPLLFLTSLKKGSTVDLNCALVNASLNSNSCALAATDIAFSSTMNNVRTLILSNAEGLVKEGIPRALIQSSNNEKIEINKENIEDDVKEFIHELIKEKEIFIKERGMGAVGALMGPVMSEFRGKMDGGEINKLLIEKIKEIV